MESFHESPILNLITKCDVSLGSVMKSKIFSLIAILLMNSACLDAGEKIVDTNNKEQTGASGDTEIADFGAGCFWCTEAVFERLKGVKAVVSGYQGGKTDNPTYKAICSGTTGHTEVSRVEFEPKVISYNELLDLFWEMHDPTTLNRQGADKGTQYRSAIYYHSEEQRKSAEESKKKKDASGAFRNPIVTEITKAPKFYAAEKYHQDYFKNNPSAPYCLFVIKKKLDKLDKKK